MTTVTVRRGGDSRYPVTIVGCYHMTLLRSHLEPPQWRIVHINHDTGQPMPVGYARTEDEGILRCNIAIESGTCQ